MKTRLVHVSLLMLTCLALLLAGISAGASSRPMQSATATGGIHLVVLNQQDEPASEARVEAYPPGSEMWQWSGFTDSLGVAEINVPAGLWTLVVSSWSDHFVIVREGVSAPGSLTLDAAGTVPIDVMALRADGQPLAFGSVSFECFAGGEQGVGELDEEGYLQVDLSPGVYCASVVGWDERIFLNRPQVAVSGPAIVQFDAAPTRTGQVVLHLSEFTEMGLAVYAQPSCRSWHPVFYMRDGQSAVLSAGRYRLGLSLELVDDSDTWWAYRYDIKGGPRDIAAGSVTPLWAGGLHSVSLAVQQATYLPGATVSISSQLTDAYENPLREVLRGFVQEAMLPHLVVRGPHGEIIVNDHWPLDRETYSFDLAGDAPEGQYQIEWTLDTGPLQGTIQATAQFAVRKPATPTATATSTYTRTPTPTVSPSRTPTPSFTPSPSPTRTPRLPRKAVLPILVKRFAPR